MKALTISRMASARLRANRKAYITLMVGIFLSIFLVTALCLCIQGVFLARAEEKYRQVGYMDMFDMDDQSRTDQDVERMGLFDSVGHITVVGEVNGTNLYLGYGDEAGYDLVNYSLLEGRMPENAGEIALERSALLALDMDLRLGDTVNLTVTPVDGTAEARSFTIVGILREKTEYLTPANDIHYADYAVTQFPAILLADQEPAFATGRLAVHRVMSLKPGQDLREALRLYIRKNGYQHLYFVNASGEVLDAYDNDFSTVMGLNREFLILLTMVALLAGALLIGCCVGIAVSMEGLLSRRSEEIGILRAVGATKRQIRRIFGRESLLLALAAAPLAVLCGCGCTAVLQWRMPEQIRFRANPWLLLPVGLISVAVILISSGIPLRRAANKMPMSVLRDTELLRKTKHLRSRSAFRVPRLLALRQMRLHPTRQIGAVLLVMLMLLGAATLGCVALTAVDTFTTESAAFSIYLPFESGAADCISVIPGHTMTWQDVERIGNLPEVKRVEASCMQDATLLTEGESSYFSSGRMDPDWYGTVQKFLQTDMGLEPFVPIVAYDLFADEQLLNSVVNGEIDLEALNSGREVVVLAPTIWGSHNPDGTGYSYASREKRNEQDQDTMLSTNDYFYAGQVLQLAQLSVTDDAAFVYSDTVDLSTADCRKVSVTVGAVVDAISEPVGIYDLGILTTTQGLRNLGLYSDGIRKVDIFLNEAVDRETEDGLEQSITAIARRSDGANVYNQMDRARENEAARGGYLLLFGSITLIFFAAAVGLILSGVTRQLQQDARTIGMLRAVGADEKAIVGCYGAPVTVSVILALIAAMGALAGLLSAIDLRLTKETLLLVLAGMLAFAAVCALLCQGLLRLRVREITRKSIIETIREL